MTLLMKLNLTIGLASVLLTGLWYLCHRFWDHPRIEYYSWLRSFISWVDDWLDILVMMLWVTFIGLGVAVLVRLIWGS